MDTKEAERNAGFDSLDLGIKVAVCKSCDIIDDVTRSSHRVQKRYELCL